MRTRLDITLIRTTLLSYLLITPLLASEVSCRTQMLMGTYAELCAPKADDDVIQQGFDRLKAVENALSSYDPNADIYRLNHDRKARLQKDTYEALHDSIRYHKESQGYFDITVGSITKGLYHFGEQERVPNESDYAKVRTDISGVIFDEHEASLEPGITLDLGGMGKGFGVDKVYTLYRDLDITEGKIAISGDIRCVSVCQIAVTDPFAPDATIATMHARAPGLGITTSGDYRRYVKTKAHHHLIDPRSRHSATAFASITLIGHIPNADLDAYATAAAVMPVEEALAFLGKYPIAYLLYTMDGHQIISDNIDVYVDRLHLFKARPERSSTDQKLF